MEKDFWIARWKEKQIGFHQSSTNQYLMKYTSNWIKGSTVFVPLCGKSLDLIWLLNKGFHVIGVELSPIAIKEFYEENKVPFQKTKEGNFTVYESPNLTIYEGDFFELKKSYLKEVAYVYDRAALIALPDVLRKKYADKLKSLTDLKDYLLITLMREESNDPNLGPPFNVSPEDVKKLFHPEFNFELKEKEKINDPERGVFLNYVFSLTF